ncbi:hypothetical protein AKJ09_00673 [Labilithrix luteola]|uniref:Uncharacterized protein n=1 Tax=Labilithrix luteola TaxID=1391654 RepID=A0A0K1PLL6_9BACT|nr:hypothetical protein [Labilithrix luteola]AKU94009.1 hypothetical protein AKJ09_00673 [Labilithrix luteola]
MRAAGQGLLRFRPRGVARARPSVSAFPPPRGGDRAARACLDSCGDRQARAPGATLDDAYIHFQYARAIAEGHPFRFQAGEPISTGATSFLWPAVLAVPYLFGWHGEALLWPAWVLSYVALGALAYEAYRLARPLAGRTAGLGAGAMTLAFGGFAWCAASGMEVVPFAWVIAHASRRGADWVEDPESRTGRSLAWLVALAVAAPLARPEGAVTSLVLGLAVALAPRRPGLTSRAEALAFPLAALVPNLLLLVLTGHTTSSTAQVKLLAGNPYYAVADASLSNARTLVTTLLNGEIWSSEFLPKGGAAFACAGLVAIAWRGSTTKNGFRAFVVIVLALTMFVPCTYVTFLWNRLRYLWPFATGWFVGLACLARVAGELVARVDRHAGAATTALVAGGFAGMLAVRLDWVIEDVAQSASGIDRQQVELGRWVDKHLPKDVRVGVNDTGAIAYFGNRKTFDVVGLTTASEGRYWVAGAGSRLEHYERLQKSSPASLPTHFVVYPEWMACDAVLGRSLHEATVTDSSILGGQTMRVYEARLGLLGTGEKPWSKAGTILDAIDVADLESEQEHNYALLGAHDGEQVATEGNAPDGSVVIDGGRSNRTRERFEVHAPPGRALHGIGRVEVSSNAVLDIQHAGKSIARVKVEPGGWTEVSFDVPANTFDDGKSELEVTSDSAFTSFHWWFTE